MDEIPYTISDFILPVNYGFGIGYGISPKVLADLGLGFGIGPKEIEMINLLFPAN